MKRKRRGEREGMRSGKREKRYLGRYPAGFSPEHNIIKHK